MRRLSSYLLVLSVGLSVVVAPLWGQRSMADVNGDHRVDVLDAQALVAEALTDDGVIDVLDLQTVLGGHEAADRPRESDSPDTSCDATLPSHVTGPAQQGFHVAIIMARSSDERLASGPVSPCFGVAPSPVSAVRQYLRNLSPHAPPARA